MKDFAAVAGLLQDGVGAAYPAAVLSCGRAGAEFTTPVGAAELTTVFDLASLTKALCTSVLVMRHVQAGTLDLEEQVALGDGRGPRVRLWQLLAHCSGLPPGPPPLWAEHQGLLAAPTQRTRSSVAHMAAAASVRAAAEAVYSDLGFILLGHLLEQRTGVRLDEQFQPLAAALDLELGFRPLDRHPDSLPIAAARCAPTRRESPRREPLCGQVHDDNARAMLGVAGHAGLFGTAASVHRFAAALLDTYHDAGTREQRALGLHSVVVRRFFALSTPADLGTTWGLGWDHPEPLHRGAAASSAGSLWPRSGVGHLGFTGCSLWLDLERRGVVVLLSNRVCAATPAEAEAKKARLRQLRPALHDAVQSLWQRRRVGESAAAVYTRDSFAKGVMPMKLFFSPSACSLSPHIVLHEAGLSFELEQVHLGSKKTKSGADFRAINPKGYVPALQLDDGQVLTEGPAIVQYIADRKPETGLAPAAGTLERYRLQEWLNYISTELHKSFSPLFNSKYPAELKQQIKDALGGRFDYLSKHLEERPYIMGQSFTVADAYLFTVLRWTKFVEMDLGRWPVLVAYSARVGERPAVRAALAAEAG